MLPVFFWYRWGGGWVGDLSGWVSNKHNSIQTLTGRRVGVRKQRAARRW